MGQRSATGRARHRVERNRRGWAGVTATVSAAGAAAVAIAGAAAIGVAPTLSASPELLANLHYLRGTNIGYSPTQQEYEDFIRTMLDGTDTAAPDAPFEMVPYNAGFWPFSNGGFGDLTYNASVRQGIELLEAQQVDAGDLIFGFSQGAVVASKYKGTHTGNTYVLVANPSRANGGVMERFRGWTIPFVNVTFSGATPNNGIDGAPGDLTIDVARQYDGWADFPTYLWNPVAIANTLVGIALVHGNTQFAVTAADLEAAKASGDRDHYQFHAGSNTAYYVVKTYPVPLLMPLDPFLPDSIIAALDAPLRAFIETAYNRTDYAVPTRASLFRPWGQSDALAAAPVYDEPVEPAGPAEEPSEGSNEPATQDEEPSPRQEIEPLIAGSFDPAGGDEPPGDVSDELEVTGDAPDGAETGEEAGAETEPEGPVGPGEGEDADDSGDADESGDADDSGDAAEPAGGSDNGEGADS